MELRKLVAILQDVAHSGYGNCEVLFRTSEEGVVEVWLT